MKLSLFLIPPLMEWVVHWKTLFKLSRTECNRLFCLLVFSPDDSVSGSVKVDLSTRRCGGCGTWGCGGWGCRCCFLRGCKAMLTLTLLLFFLSLKVATVSKGTLAIFPACFFFFLLPAAPLSEFYWLYSLLSLFFFFPPPKRLQWKENLET